MAEQPSSFVFFIDRSLGRHDVPEVLRSIGTSVELHDDHFPPTTPDVEWLTAVGERGWIVLTKDQRIRRSPHELQALVAARLRVFILTGRRLTGTDMAATLLHHWKRIEHEAKHRPSPFVAIVSRFRVRLLPIRGLRT